MKKGLSVWLFSKIVMLIFLMVIFGIVVGFNNVLGERSRAEAAESLCIQVKDSIQASLTSISMTSRQVVPLPTSLPETSASSTDNNQYTLVISSTPVSSDSLISVAIAFGVYNQTGEDSYSGVQYYSAASSFVSADTVPEIVANSVDHRYLVIEKTENYIEICACAIYNSCPDYPKYNDYCERVSF